MEQLADTGLTIRRVALTDLHADPANARAHDEVNLAAIWYRDPAGGGAGFNLTDASKVRFCPGARVPVPRPDGFRRFAAGGAQGRQP